MTFSTRPLPTIVLLGLFGYACPTPKAGDDRLPVEGIDVGISKPDGGSPDPDAATQDGSPADGGRRVDLPDGSTPDGATPDGGDAGDSGTPECIPTGPEDCFNSLDDDCNNAIDCNDPACGACVAVPMGFALGVIIDAASPCPAGFETQETPIFAGLDPGPGCVGSCACSPNPTTCLGELYIYANNNQCINDVNLTGGQLYTGLIDANCTANPVADGFPGGYRLGNWTVMQSCAASGVASPSPYAWMAQRKFCVPALGLQGCDATSACVPAPALPDTCVMIGGGAACPAPFSDRMVQWFTGLSDTRSCGACDCNEAGGSCQFARISIGSDYVCTDQVELTQQNPQSCGSPYSPPARVTGFPTEPTCSPFSQQTGTIEATGQQTICCQP